MDSVPMMATELPHHLRIFASPHPSFSSSTDFPQFARLPKELRLHVWQLSLRRERFIRVELSRRDTEHSDETKQDYYTNVYGNDLIPKLLHTCSEARQLALARYRIRIPCRYANKGLEPGTLFIDPELDMLGVNTDHCAQGFASFITDLRAVDRKGGGLAQIAITSNELNRLDSLQVSNLDDARREAFTAGVGNLTRVVFLCLESAGREFLGRFGGIPDNQRFEVHRSRPIFPKVTTFDCLTQDPRPIDRDLSRVFVGTFDPRRMPQHWKHLLSRWQCQQQASLQFLVAHSDSSTSELGTNNIVDHKTALNWVQGAELSWLKKQERFRSQIERQNNLTIPLENEQELQAAPQPAMGFWLFPVEAMGRLPGRDNYDRHARYWRSKRVLNLVKYRPQLYAAHLP